MHKNLGEFLQHLEENGDLVRIAAPVNRDLEITEIADRVMRGPHQKTSAFVQNVPGFYIPWLSIVRSHGPWGPPGLNKLENLTTPGQLVDSAAPRTALS